MGKRYAPPKVDSYLPEVGVTGLPEFSSVPLREYDPQLSKEIFDYRFRTTQDKIAKSVEGLMSPVEKQMGYDYFEQEETDEDGVIRTYTFARDSQGNVRKLGLVDGMDAVKLQDVISGKAQNPYYERYIKNKMFGQVMKDIDPDTGELRGDLSKGFFENALMNSMTAQLGVLGAKIFGDKNIARYGVMDALVNKLEFNEDGTISYAGTNLGMSDSLSALGDWFQRKTTYQSSGFMDSFANTALTFLIDAPMFYVGGRGASAVLGKLAPVLMQGSSIPAKLGMHIGQNYLMLQSMGTAGMINHTIDGGVDALLDDIKHTAEFSLLAGTFSTFGDMVGLGVSKLLQKPAPLSTANVTSFLKKNPRVHQNLVGGFTSGMLGYTTATGDEQEKLAVGLAFASMHFATPEGWRGYIKGEKKKVMVENDNFKMVEQLLRTGKAKNVEEAIKLAGVQEPRYYLREDNKLFEISNEAFVRKGSVEKLEQAPITLDKNNASNYKYITEAVPFAKRTLRQALRDDRIEQIRQQIIKEGFKDVKNPYNQSTQSDQYANFEYNKLLASSQLATVLYADKLFKQIKQNGLPKDYNLQDIITTSAEGLNLPRHLFEKFVIDNFPAYVRDPKAWSSRPEAEGGSMKFFPEEYRKSFESALFATEQAFKRQANERMLEQINDIYFKKYGEEGRLELTKLTEEEMKKFFPADYEEAFRILQNAREMSDIYRAIEKAGYSEKVFDELRGKVKAEETAREEYNQKAEDALNSTLNTEAGLAMIEREFGSRRFAKVLTKDEISEIGKTGAIDPKTREALQKLSEESWKDGITDEQIISSAQPDGLLPESLGKKVEEQLLGYDVLEPREGIVKPTGERVIIKDTFGTGEKNGAEAGFYLAHNERGVFVLPKSDIQFIGREIGDHQTFIREIREAPLSEIAITIKKETEREWHSADTREPFKKDVFWKRVLKNLGLNSSVFDLYTENTKYTEVNENVKRSVAEVVTSMEDAILHTFGKDSQTHKEWKRFDHIWAIAKKMPEVGFNFFTEKRSSTGAFYNSTRDNIALNMAYSKNSFWEMRESMAHEIIHAILYGKYKTANGREVGYEERLEPELRSLWKRARKVYLSDREAGALSSSVKHWGDYVFNIDGQTVSPLQELATVGFTAPDFARYLNSIAVDGIRRETRGTIFQALRDKIYEWIGLTRIHEKSALDELTEIVNNTFADWGIFDQQTGTFKDNVRVGNYDNFPNQASKPIFDIPLKNESELLLGGSDAKTKAVDTNISPEKIATVNEKLDKNFDRKNEVRENEPLQEERLNTQPITLDKEPATPLPKVEPKAKSRKVEKEETIAPRAEVIRNRELSEKEYLKTARVQNKDRKEQVMTLGEKAQEFVLRHNKLQNFTNMVKDHLYQSIVPVFRKDVSPRFNNEVYKYGEELIRYAPYHFNTIVKRFDGWAEGRAWRKFADSNPVTGEVRSKNGIDLLNAFKDYEYARYQGKVSKDLTWDEFKTWANFNPEQSRMLDIYRNSLKAGIDKMKEMKVRYMVELDPNLASHVTKSEKSLKEFGMEGVEKEVIEQRVQENQELRKKIAQKVVDDHYSNWDKFVYYNSIRPVDKDTIIVEVRRNSMERKDKDGNFLEDREYSYFQNMKEAQDYLNSRIADGWTKQEMFRVKDILTKQDHWGKLNVSQLMQLANEGHIPLTNEIIQKLMEVSKKGVDLHDVRKEYVPGMKYTGQEFELQFERFLREAIYGSYKSYSLTKINDNLNKWRADIDSIIGGISKTATKGIDAQTVQKLEEEYKYAYGYYNQLRSPEKSVIDPIRGLTFSFLIGGIKPGFLAQQSLQTLQTSLHQAYAELKANNLGTFGDAVRHLGEASAESLKAGLALRALKKGEDISKLEVDPEYVRVLQELELMGKMRAVGIEEISGLSGESDFYYSGMGNKLQEGYVRISNALGGMVEKFTRVQTAGLFYRIGKAKGLRGEELVNYVADGLDKGMSEFGKGGRAPVFDSKGSVPNQGTIVNALKKSFLTLKTFSFYNMSMYHNLVKQQQWGALGTKMIAGLGMHGITKFPLMASLFMIAELFTDEEVDYTVLRVAEELDDKMPVPIGSFLRGGFGSFVGIDTKDMLSETTPLVTDLVANSWAPTWEGKLLEVTLGAPLGFSKDAVEAAQGIKEILSSKILGDTVYTKEQRDRQWKKFDKVSPLWLRNIFKSMDYARDGVMLRGEELVSRDDLSGWDIFLKAMSFPVERINDAYIEDKSGIDAQIGHYKSVIMQAKKYMIETRDNPNLSGDVKRDEIRKAEESLKDAKKQLVNLEKQKIERDRK